MSSAAREEDTGEDVMRKPLPILQYEQRIVELVKENPVTVVIADTGSGKTTQISQFLVKAGFTDDGRTIAVTQPRRVAAVSVARRVASEMSVELGREVGYSIRFEDRTCNATKIKYITDGCLLREFLEDDKVSRYSVIVLDEAHERSLNTDVLFGLLKKRILSSKGNQPRVVITSATLDGEQFSAFFMDCPVLSVPGRMYPVHIAYADEMPKQYVEACVDLALDLHLDEDDGDILVFLTGQEDIEKAVKMISEKVAGLDEECGDLLPLPMYASLPPQQQAQIFAPAPPGCRRVIFSTNLAETSLTVDGVVYVVDPGFVKYKVYNPKTGMETLQRHRISRAQAKQRAGRAGRTRAGKCFRLYPQSVHDHELETAMPPEILRSSLSSTVLQLKTIVNNVDVLGFDFLDHPGIEPLEDALKQLFVLGAIDEEGQVTRMGLAMSRLPLEPSLARALIAANESDCLQEAITVAAMLSSENLFIGSSRSAFKSQHRGEEDAQERKLAQQLLKMSEGKGDHILLLRLYEGWQHANYSRDYLDAFRLQPKALKFVKDVKAQLESVMSSRQHRGREGDRRWERGRDMERDRDGGRVRDRHTNTDRPRERDRDNHRNRDRSRDRGRDWPREGGSSFSSGKVRALRRALAVGYANRLAHRMPNHNGYRALSDEGFLVEVHPTSAKLLAANEGLLPEWLIYHDMVATSRPYLRQVCAVEGEGLAPLLKRSRNIDVRKLSGRIDTQDLELAEAADKPSKQEGKDVVEETEADKAAKRATAVDDARARYLARKAARQG